MPMTRRIAGPVSGAALAFGACARAHSIASALHQRSWQYGRHRTREIPHVYVRFCATSHAIHLDPPQVGASDAASSSMTEDAATPQLPDRFRAAEPRSRARSLARAAD